MFKNMDDYALMSSEVFRNFMKIEAQKEQEKNELEKKSAVQIRYNAAKSEIDHDTDNEVLAQFNGLQEKINGNDNLKKRFKLAKERLINDPELRAKTHPAFVQGVMLLDIKD